MTLCIFYIKNRSIKQVFFFKVKKVKNLGFYNSSFNNIFSPYILYIFEKRLKIKNFSDIAETCFKTNAQTYFKVCFVKNK